MDLISLKNSIEDFYLHFKREHDIYLRSDYEYKIMSFEDIRTYQSDLSNTKENSVLYGYLCFDRELMESFIAKLTAATVPASIIPYQFDCQFLNPISGGNTFTGVQQKEFNLWNYLNGIRASENYSRLVYFNRLTGRIDSAGLSVNVMAGTIGGGSTQIDMRVDLLFQNIEGWITTNLSGTNFDGQIFNQFINFIGYKFNF